MKKLLFLTVLVGFAFNSCKKDDDDKPLIVGTWKIEKYFYKYANGTSETELPDECDSKTQITFKEDGTIVNDEYYSTSGNGNCNANYETGTYYYNESSNILSINLGNSTDEFKVITLNNSQLAIQDDSDDYDGDGSNDVYIGYLKR